MNQIGTYQIAVVAKAAKKPFYVVTESHKFVRMFPLNQYEVFTPIRSTSDRSSLSNRTSLVAKNRSRHINPQGGGEFSERVDYTPPTYITLMFTDLGVLTPTAASEELAKHFS